jgi:hypothetical protein
MGLVMDDLGSLVAKQQISDVITDLFVATDRRDWDTVLGCFAPEVLLDMSSLTGVAPSTVAARDIVSGWETGLAPLRAVHHQIGNLKIELEPGAAHATCYGTATHYLPNASGRNTRVFVGSYDLTLERDGGRWRITRFRFECKYVEGNLELEKSA